MKLNPHATPDEYDEVWAGADVNGDGSLQPEELAAYFGFDWSSLAKDMDDLKLQNSNDMSDEDILNALLVRPHPTPPPPAPPPPAPLPPPHPLPTLLLRNSHSHSHSPYRYRTSRIARAAWAKRHHLDAPPFGRA